MDKTIQIVVVAAVVMMVAVVLIFLVTGRVGGFAEDTQAQTDQADCDYLQAQFEKEKAFGSCGRAEQYKQDAQDSCQTEDWGTCTEGSTTSESSSEAESSPPVPGGSDAAPPGIA